MNTHDDEQEPRYWVDFERFQLQLAMGDAESGSHPGPCDDDIAALREVPYIKAQLEALDPDKANDELREYGAWDDEERADHDANLSRVLWLACGNLVDERVAEREEAQP